MFDQRPKNDGKEHSSGSEKASGTALKESRYLRNGNRGVRSGQREPRGGEKDWLYSRCDGKPLEDCAGSDTI